MNGSTPSKLNHNRLAMWTILLTATLAALSSCATVKPVLQSVIVRDTVIVTKTKYLTDTLELYKDTTIYQDKVRLQLQYIDRKVYVEATCLPDTIRVTQTKILTKEKKQRGWTLEGGLTILAFVLVAAYFVKKWIDKLLE
tara:strand:- start:99 stop:518 length:420 start_codon:yes stop_codon:yes gene_type:complete